MLSPTLYFLNLTMATIFVTSPKIISILLFVEISKLARNLAQYCIMYKKYIDLWFIQEVLYYGSLNIDSTNNMNEKSG